MAASLDHRIRLRIRPLPSLIRHADPERDAAGCAAIYEPFVTASPISFELNPPGADQLAKRIERTSATHPWLVCERDGALTGYAYACPHRERAAYRWAAEVSVYVAPDGRRAGTGRALYEALFDLLRRQRLRIALAGITLPNEPSVALHEALGFEHVGTFRRIGHKLGRWHDVGWWQLELAPEGDDGPEADPPEPLGPQRLPGGELEL